MMPQSSMCRVSHSEKKGRSFSRVCGRTVILTCVKRVNPCFIVTHIYFPLFHPKVGNGIQLRKNSTEQTRNGFHYSAEESGHFEAFRGLRKSQFRSSEWNGMAWKNWFSKKSCSSKQRVFVRDMLQNGIPRVCFFFCFTVQNSQLFSPLRNSSKRNSESFLFRGTPGIPQEQTNCSVYSVFRGIIFFVGNCQPYSTLPPQPRASVANFKVPYWGIGLSKWPDLRR